MALYTCEIWGFENSQIIENLHNDFLRQIINLRKSTPIYMLHAELGQHPIQINIKSRMIGFWLSIVNGKESKLSKLLYAMMLKEHEKGSYNFKWIRCINDILVAVGRPDLFKTEPITQILWKWIFHKHCQICIFKNGMRNLTFLQKENNIFYLKTISILKIIWLRFQNFIIPKLPNIELVTIGSQLRLDDGMI